MRINYVLFVQSTQHTRRSVLSITSTVWVVLVLTFFPKTPACSARDGVRPAADGSRIRASANACAHADAAASARPRDAERSDGGIHSKRKGKSICRHFPPCQQHVANIHCVRFP